MNFFRPDGLFSRWPHQRRTWSSSPSTARSTERPARALRARVLTCWFGAARCRSCDVTGVDPDAVTVDALARLQLAARRNGCRVRLRHASAELLELVAFMGLTNVLLDR